MKTTIELPDDLMVEVKVAAARRRVRLRKFVEAALRREMRNAGDAPLALRATSARKIAEPGEAIRYRKTKRRGPGRTGAQGPPVWPSVKRVAWQSHARPRASQSAPKTQKRQKPFRWTTTSGGLAPGFDVSSREHIYEWLAKEFDRS